MNIYLKKGLDSFIFGMVPSEVEKIYGKPNREIVDEDDDNQLIWEYTERKIRLTFYRDESDKLGYIRSSNVNLKLDQYGIIDKRIEEVKNQIDPNPDSWEEDDYGLFKTYFNESNWLILNVEYERVTDIEFGVPFKNDEEYDWPK